MKEKKNTTIEYLQFTEEYDGDDNLVYTFHPLGKSSKNKYGQYTTKITVNELGEEIDGSIPIIKTECNCTGFMKVKKECKHITDAIKIIESYGRKLNKPKLNRYWCTTCRKEVQAEYNTKVMCYDCEHQMNEAHNDDRYEKN
jgi:RecJ-like exonuclease